MDIELTRKLHEIFSKCQAWLDDEKIIPRKFSNKSWSDEFAEKIVCELESEMIKQKFCFPNSKLYLPSQYLVEINAEDSREFTRSKREILLRELNRFVERCLRMLSVETINTEFVRLQTSEELKKGEIKVIHQWDESYSPIIRFNRSPEKFDDVEFDDFSEDTIIAPIRWKTVTDDFEDENDCETIVKSGTKRSFSLEISRNGIYQNVLPVFQPQITLGRGSVSRPVDVLLEYDPQISRQHLVLRKEMNNWFKLSVTGQNPIFINENKLFAGQTADCFFGETIKIGIYLLKLQA